MFGGCFFCVLVASTAVHGQTTPSQTTVPVSELPEISKNFTSILQFSLRNDKLPQIINYLLITDTTFPTTTKDFFDLSQLEQLNIDETLAFLSAFGVDRSQVFTIDALEAFLKAIKTTFGVFYASWLKREPTLDRIEEVLQLADQPGYYKAISRGNESIYEILKLGAYNAETLAQVEELTGKSSEELFFETKRYFITELSKLPKADFADLLLANGWSKPTAIRAWTALNLTSADTLLVPVFQQIFYDIHDKLNNKRMLGVFVGPTSLVVHEDIYAELDRNVLGGGVRIVANGLEVGGAPMRRFGEGIFEFELAEATGEFVPATDNYRRVPPLCQLVTQVGGEVAVSAVRMNRDFSGTPAEGAGFQVGAPLVCNGRVYGLARNETETAIYFDKFYTLDNPQPSAGGRFGVGFGLVAVCVSMLV